MLPLLVNRFVRTFSRHTKLVTRFPYVEHKKKPPTSIGLSSPSFSDLPLPQLLLSDGNGTLGLTARDAGKGEITDNKVNKFARVNGTRRGYGTLRVYWKRAK